MPFLNTHEQLLLADENIGIQDQLKDSWIPHVIRSTMISLVFYKSELAWLSYSLCYITVRFL